MAHFTERHLNCKQTEKFLTEKGFRLTKDCVYSKWVTFGFQLHLKVDDQIRNDSDLYEFIAHAGYMDGVKDGKEEALEKITKIFKDAIFPPQPYKEPTYA